MRDDKFTFELNKKKQKEKLKTAYFSLQDAQEYAIMHKSLNFSNDMHQQIINLMTHLEDILEIK